MLILVILSWTLLICSAYVTYVTLDIFFAQIKGENLKTLNKVVQYSVHVYVDAWVFVGLRHVYSFYLCWRVLSMQFIKIRHYLPNGFIKMPQLPFYTSGKWSSAATYKQKLVHGFHLSFMVVADLYFIFFYSMNAGITGWQFDHQLHWIAFHDI